MSSYASAERRAPRNTPRQFGVRASLAGLHPAAPAVAAAVDPRTTSRGSQTDVDAV